MGGARCALERLHILQDCMNHRRQLPLPAAGYIFGTRIFASETWRTALRFRSSGNGRVRTHWLCMLSQSAVWIAHETSFIRHGRGTSCGPDQRSAVLGAGRLERRSGVPDPGCAASAAAASAALPCRMVVSFIKRAFDCSAAHTPDQIWATNLSLGYRFQNETQQKLKSANVSCFRATDLLRHHRRHQGHRGGRSRPRAQVLKVAEIPAAMSRIPYSSP